MSLFKFMKNTPKVKKEQIKPQNVQRTQDDKRKRPNKSLTPLKKQKIHTNPILNHTVLWEKLKQLKHPNAKTIEKSLDDRFPWGFDDLNPPKGFRANVIEQLIYCKKIYPTHIVLVKSGNFFCTYGIDAVLCVEYANLHSEERTRVRFGSCNPCSSGSRCLSRCLICQCRDGRTG